MCNLKYIGWVWELPPIPCYINARIAACSISCEQTSVWIFFVTLFQAVEFSVLFSIWNNFLKCILVQTDGIFATRLISFKCSRALSAAWQYFKRCRCHFLCPMWDKTFHASIRTCCDGAAWLSFTEQNPAMLFN